jgi:hypothetical protein
LAQTSLEGGFLIEGIEGKATQESKIVGGMKRADAAIIFLKGDIKSPVERIFNPPVLTDGRGNSGTMGG